MAETRITPIEPTAPYFSEAGSPQLATMTAVSLDATNGNVISLSSDILLLFENSNVGAQTVTITSVADPFGRTATITAFSISAAAYVARVFTRVGWANAGGDLVISGSHADINIWAIQL